MVIWFRGLSLFSFFGVIAIFTANRHLHLREPAGQISQVILKPNDDGIFFWGGKGGR